MLFAIELLKNDNNKKQQQQQKTKQNKIQKNKVKK